MSIQLPKLMSTFESVEWLCSLWPLTLKLTPTGRHWNDFSYPGANFHPTCHLFAVPCLSGMACAPNTGRRCWTELGICYIGLQTGQCIPSSVPAPVPCDTLLVLRCFAYLEHFVCLPASGVVAICKQPWQRYLGSAVVAVNVAKSAK